MDRIKSCILLVAFAATTAGAAPVLNSAKVTQVQNDVRLKEGVAVTHGTQDPAPPRNGKVAERAAKIGDTIQGTRTLSTGRKSRAELTFNDNTIARLGANSVFSFKPGSRDIDLKSGYLLLHTPKGQGGAKITTPSAAASVLGTTIMLAALPGGGMKLVVLEGTASIKYNGVTQNIGAGQLVFLTPGEGMSPPITVDLKQMVGSSGLFTGFKGGVGSEQLIQEAIKDQADLIAEGELEQSGFNIAGDGTLSTVNAAAIEALLEEFDKVQNALGESAAEVGEDLTGSFVLSPPGSIDFSTPIAGDGAGLSLLGVANGNGGIEFNGDRFYFTQGPPASLSNLQGVNTVSFIASGQSVDYLTRLNAIRFDNFESTDGGFSNLNLVFRANRGSVGVYNSEFSQNGNLTFRASGRALNAGNLDIFNSSFHTTGTGIFMNTTAGNILLDQSQIAIASNLGNQVLFDAPGAGSKIMVRNSTINTGLGSIPGGITIPANQTSGTVDVINSNLHAANNVLAAPVRIFGSEINLTASQITGSTVVLGNQLGNAVINFHGNQNTIFTNTGVDGLVINGTAKGIVNVGTIGQQGTTPVGTQAIP
jgi:hypothetical protein